MEIKREHWGELKDGTEVWLYTLANDSGMQAQISTYGGTIVSLWVPDRYGEAGDVVLGFETLAEYVDHSPYFGCVVGRYANRIARGRFTLDGVTYQLACNDGPNHLHGGEVGFDKRVWSSSTRESDQGEPVLELSLISPDGDQGYPGTLRVRVSYTLTDANALRIDYEATTDAPTILN
ncbi:MAG TPA: galactose-1-epimerase, partial [Chloroflexi bacterium]|nr:galactose-1-epimerase [Chloroflexota bacterium]